MKDAGGTGKFERLGGGALGWDKWFPELCAGRGAESGDTE